MKKILGLIFMVLPLALLAQDKRLKYYGFCNDTIRFENKYLVVGNKKFYVDNFPVNPECDTIVEHYYLFTSPCGTECREIVIFDAKTYKISKFYYVFEINYKTQKLLTRNTKDPRYLNIYNFEGELVKSIKIVDQPYACLFCYIDLKNKGDKIIIHYKNIKASPNKKEYIIIKW